MTCPRGVVNDKVNKIGNKIEESMSKGAIVLLHTYTIEESMPGCGHCLAIRMRSVDILVLMLGRGARVQTAASIPHALLGIIQWNLLQTHSYLCSMLDPY